MGSEGATGQGWPSGSVPSRRRGLRILLIDFDVFTTRGGGQTFYRRVIDRHPEDLVFYPSRGPDLRLSASLPPNARPFAVDSLRDVPLEEKLPADGLPWTTFAHILLLASLGRALQGQAFDVVEVPSYRACAYLVRPVLDAYGILVGRISLSLLGWLSTSLAKADAHWPGLAEIREDENQCVAAADVCYTISALHAAENVDRTGAVGIVAMRDALEVVPVPEPLPPSGGAPDLCYVGRLDLAKGPDLFLAIAARMERTAYRILRLVGTDNDWEPPGGRWSDHLRELAARLGLEAQFDLQMSDEALRAEIYAARTVVVIPSRTDSFNLVALEALSHGVPILLSRHTGAAGFLEENHPAIAPPIIEPEDVETSAAALAALLRDYPAQAAGLRAKLRQHPLSGPRPDFLHAFWRDAEPVSEAPADPRIYGLLRRAQVLDTPAAQAWRRRPSPHGRLTAAVVVRDAAEALRRTLASLAWQSSTLAEILVVDDGSCAPLADLGGGIRVVRQGRQGLAAACNRAASTAIGTHVLFLLAGDLLAPGPTREVDEVIGRMEKTGADVMSLCRRWLPGPGPASERPEASWEWDEPALLCGRTSLIEAGGFAASEEGAALLVPPGLRLEKGSQDEAPSVWSQRRAAEPWWTADGGVEGSEGRQAPSPHGEAIAGRTAA